MCWGTFCGPVGTTLEALKFNANVGRESPDCAALAIRFTDIVPDTDGSYPSIIKGDAEPMIFRISSRPQAPAACSCPSAQFRKRARLFENSIGLNGFSAGLRPFRAWVLGTGGTAGGYNAPGLPNIEGSWNANGFGGLGDTSNITGAFSRGSARTCIINGQAWTGAYDVKFKASLSHPIYGASATVMPPSVNAPVILYLGRAAQI